jgi:folate-binding Fe-S cluster repair protein YgfZ
VPAEAGLEGLIDAGKGCFLGQESVAKIRNLGHPARVVRSLRAHGDVRAGAEVVAGGAVVGTITSAAPAAGGGTACLARVRWAAAEAALTAEGGVALEPHRPST